MQNVNGSKNTQIPYIGIKLQNKYVLFVYYSIDVLNDITIYPFKTKNSNQIMEKHSLIHIRKQCKMQGMAYAIKKKNSNYIFPGQISLDLPRYRHISIHPQNTHTLIHTTLTLL